jgi:hypothetical protein
MNTPQQAHHVHTLDHERLAAEAARVRDLFNGAVALLSGDCGYRAATTARAVLLEASAYVGSLVETVEGLAARKAEAERAERLHREEAARRAGGAQ